VANVQHSITEALAGSPAADLLRRLHAARAALETIRPVVEDIAPGVDLSSPAAVELGEGVLYLTTSSAAQAAKLRQSTPRLLSRLQQSGTQVSEIRFRIQPKPSTYQEHGSGAPSLDPSGARQAAPFLRPEDVRIALVCFEKLRLQLKDPALRSAVSRLEKSVRSRLENAS
jgi:hypothetical protein